MICSIGSIDGTLTGTISPGQSGSWSKGIEEVFYIPQTASLEPHHQIVSCHIQNIHLGRKYCPSSEMESGYSTAPADWALCTCLWGVYTWTRVCVYKYLCTCVYLCTFAYICRYVNDCLCMDVHNILCVFVCVLIYIRLCPCCYHIYPTPPLGQDMTQGQFSSGV